VKQITYLLANPAYRDWRNQVFRWMALSLGFHLLAAVFSLGFQAADEHFQILEFAAFKLGRTPESHLSMEFKAMMRPWLQPAAAWTLFQGWRAIGVEDPFTWAWSLRLLSGLLGWLSTVALALTIPQWITEKRWQKLTLIALSLIWYFPALHVRPSSESWGGTFLVLAISSVFLLSDARDPKRSLSPGAAAVVGALFGLSFESRFQMAVAIVGALAWLLFMPRSRYRVSPRAIGALLGGGLLVFIAGRLIDRWGYGAWSFSPYNYVEFNLIQNHVSDFGTMPWWGYFQLITIENWPPLGILLLILSLIGMCAQWRHILTWSYIPFLAVHFWIGHKETRFLFPVATSGPLLLVFGLMAIQNWGQSLGRGWAALRPLLFGIAGLIAINNCFALIAYTLLPASKTVSFYRAVSHEVAKENQARPNEQFLIHSADGNPFMYLGSHVDFYWPKQVRVDVFASLQEVERRLLSAPVDRPFWIFHTRLVFESETPVLQQHCSAVYQTIPGWLSGWKRLPPTVRTWSLFRCASPAGKPN